MHFLFENHISPFILLWYSVLHLTVCMFSLLLLQAVSVPVMLHMFVQLIVQQTLSFARVFTPQLFLRVSLSVSQLSCQWCHQSLWWFTIESVWFRDSTLEIWSDILQRFIILLCHRKNTLQDSDIIFKCYHPLLIAAFSHLFTSARRYLYFLFQSVDRILLHCRVSTTCVVISACLFMHREKALL